MTERHVYLVLEYCAGGDLTHVLRTHGPTSEWRAQQYLSQLGARSASRGSRARRQARPGRARVPAPSRRRASAAAPASAPLLVPL